MIPLKNRTFPHTGTQLGTSSPSLTPSQPLQGGSLASEPVQCMDVSLANDLHFQLPAHHRDNVPHSGPRVNWLWYFGTKHFASFIFHLSNHLLDALLKHKKLKNIILLDSRQRLDITEKAVFLYMRPTLTLKYQVLRVQGPMLYLFSELHKPQLCLST